MEWRQTFNAIDFPVLIIDLDGAIKRSNEAAELIAGLAAEQITGKRLTEIATHEPWKKAADLLEVVQQQSFAGFGGGYLRDNG